MYFSWQPTIFAHGETDCKFYFTAVAGLFCGGVKMDRNTFTGHVDFLIRIHVTIKCDGKILTACQRILTPQQNSPAFGGEKNCKKVILKIVLE